MGLVAHLGLKAGVGLHGGVVALVEAVCEPFEGVADAHLEGAQALGVAFEGDFKGGGAVEEVVEEGPPAGGVGFSVCPSRCHGSCRRPDATIFAWSCGIAFGTEVFRFCKDRKRR